MAEKSYADGLREYADYIDAHPELEINDGQICFYSLREANRVRAILDSHPSPRLVDTNHPEIDYLHQNFGPLSIEYVIRKDLTREPTIVDGKVVWALKSEFQAVTA